MWRRVLAHQRAREPGRPIEIVYADLPRNDFSQLFRMIHGQTDVASYYGEIPDVYPFASGTSFHQAIFPRESLDLAFSATASHYISKVPVQHRQPRAHGGRRAATSGAPTRRPAASSGSACCTCAPASSSRAGGSCFLNFGIDAEGRYLGRTGGVSMFDTFNDLWRRPRRATA